MDDRKIAVLLATVRTGSFSKAAEEVNCSQSAVTQIMNNMEAELGCRILDRSHRGVKLTPAGESLLPYIVAADSAMEQLMSEAKSIAEGKTIPIRIGAFSSIANSWLPDVIKAYKKEYPASSFHIEIGTSMLSPWLLNGFIDIAIGDAERCKGFRFYDLMDDPHYAVIPEDIAPAGDVITQEDIAAMPFIVSPGNALGTYLDVTPENTISVVTDDDATIISMVSKGLGATALPELSIQNVPDNVKVMKLVPETVRKLGIAVGNHPEKRTREFVSFVKKYFE